MSVCIRVYMCLVRHAHTCALQCTCVKGDFSAIGVSMLAVCSVCLHVRVDMPGVHVHLHILILAEGATPAVCNKTVTQPALICCAVC